MAEQFLVLKRAEGDRNTHAPTIGSQVLVFEVGKPVKIDGEAPVIVDDSLQSIPMSVAKGLVENNAEPWQGTGHPEYEITSGASEPATSRKGRGGEV